MFPTRAPALCATLCAALAAAPALAAVNPCYLDQMVADATVVLQIVDMTVQGPDAAGTCTVMGTVAQSFRGDLAVGDPAEVAFACENPEGLVGGTVYHERGDVGRAGAVEVHLAPDGTLAGYGAGLLPLDAPTEAPAYPFEALPADGTC